MASNGGARPGAGRPTKADEEKVKLLAQGALIKKYGSLEASFEALLASGSDMLTKFAYEHAFGKPREKQDISIDPESPPMVIIQPIQTTSAPIETKETE